MKNVKRRWVSKAVKNTTALALSVGLILPSMQSGMTIASAEPQSNAEEILASLTDEQRAALSQSEAKENYGLQGFEEKELKENKEISVIVQFKSKPGQVAVLDAALDGKSLTRDVAKSKVDQEHDSFKNDLKKIFPATSAQRSLPSTKKGLNMVETPYQIKQSFKTSYNGVSMTLPANQVELLLQSDVVQSIYKDTTFTIEPPSLADSKGKPGTPDAPQSTPTGDPVSFLGVDKLHKEGITGEGIKVAVIDTGVDYNHPDLKDAYKGGYDFVNNDNDPMEATYEDWKKSGSPEFAANGSAYYTDHGTHVSGTIVSQGKNNSEVSVKGIAPDAELYVYRVLGPYGTGTSANIIAAIDQAVIAGMDVMNLSLGATLNDPYFPTSTAINYAVLSGVTAVVAAGNSGPGFYSLGSPGTAAMALTVGASDISMPVTTMKGNVATGSSIELQTMARSFSDELTTFKGKSFEMVDVGLGGDADYTNKDVTGKIALVERGTHALVDKIKFAKAHGASAVLLYNNVEGHIGAYLGEAQDFIPTFSVTQHDGQALKAQVAAGKNTFTFTDVTVTKTEGDRLADFSSRGSALKTFDIKPEVVAPGVSILSTEPAYITNPATPTDYTSAYARKNGTSMATPHVAGISALMLQANPNLQPGDIKTLLMNTAEPLNGDYLPLEQGAGRVDPFEAVHPGMKVQVQDETLIPYGEEMVTIEETTGGISFGELYTGADHSINKKVTLQNFEKENKKFNANVHFQLIKGTSDPKANGVKVAIDPVIQVKKDEKKNVNVSLTLPKTAKEGVYTGYIILTNQKDKTEQYRIPFSVKTIEEGFYGFALNKASTMLEYRISQTEPMGMASGSASPTLVFNMKTPMKKMDMVWQDGKTGQDLGYATSLDLTKHNTNTYIISILSILGSYYPFTGDPDHPISAIAENLKPGYYKLKLISTSVTGKTFTNYVDHYVDIEQPEVTTSLDQESPFHEYKPGQETYPFSMQVTDPQVKEMQDAGMDVDLSDTSFEYAMHTSSLSPIINMDKDGKFSEDIVMHPEIPALSFIVKGRDVAVNSPVAKQYYFIKEGAPNAYITSPTKEVTMGDTVTATLKLDNISSLSSASWTFANLDKNFEIVDAKPNAELSQYGEAKVTLTKSGTPTVQLDLPSTTQIKDKVAAVDLTLKVKDSAFSTSVKLDSTVSIANTEGTSNLIKAGYTWGLLSSFSELEGPLTAEGFLNPGTTNKYKNVDWPNAGASIKLTQSNGNVFDITPSLVKDVNRFAISKLPLTGDLWSWEFTLPGHFKVNIPMMSGFEYKGTIYGQEKILVSTYFIKNAVAGDVNQDQVIDIKDALEIQKAWGTNTRAADINWDGTVDATDIKFVQTNYLKVNPYVSDTPAPVDQVDGKTLEDILNELGIGS
ncbi:S8 family serine peptidase [Neobacillus sp. YX16]|uniref:S8 family serine peptidase n=1 Tax=Neobacillus sp. YX16 TaxID=3047874 RepID=UPI0024C44AC8|nr:S8 family serine peptidase [Neobacillus sp. YX16]WHZ02641.1 S8 family serine peptidase [Neobacillus sp. YX16]